MRPFILATLLAATFAVPAIAGKKTDKAAPAKPVTLDLKVRDLSPNFVDFFEAASKPMPTPVPPAPTANAATAPAAPATPAAPVETEADRRWRLFKARYNFSAQADEAATRSALDAAWPKYAGVMSKVEQGFDAIASEPTPIIDTLSLQMGLDKPISVRFVTYVGTFDGKVWSAPEGDALNIYLPLEVDAATRDLPLARILAQTMLPKTADWGSQPRNLAELIVGEGVMAHAVQAAQPGKSVESYLGISADQLAALRASQKADLSTIIPKLRDGGAALTSYSGPQQLQARYAGWLLVEGLLKKKARLIDMIRQKPGDLAAVSEKTLAVINQRK
jgi:hypothetical protein